MNGFSIYGLWKKNQRVTPLFFLCLCASLFFSRTAGASETGWSWLGVETKPITKQVARQMDLPGGALITKVHLDGPSNEYLIPGDLIVSVNGNPTQQPDDLLRMLAPVTPGVQVEIGFMRQKTGRQPKSVPIVLAEMPGKALGLFLASNEEVGNRRRAREVENGVPILEVDPGSEAAN